ncbi:hypothetical protein RG47T_2906 [Mucilaginibacter polytrichastri]|uniref:Uncharacterized protein n=1 Tax=Mucilaginibacter polytrichastri TaxID=1302689 RepID=A0A1Q6A098_9SPHI|nr:hypothetical protein RG47T_2906 [Mucilaginibacter polytrichastri]
MACSDEPDPYDYYTSFFHPDIQGKKDFGAFYFTDYSFTYTDEEPASEAAINAAEWAKYLGPPVKAADVENIMYDLDSAGKEKVYHFFEQDPPVAGSLAASSFLGALNNPAHKAARMYYQFSLQAEKLGQHNYNPWEPAPVDTTGLKTAAAQALQAAKDENDSFLKLRYFYQAQKLNHYAENYAEAKSIYDQYITKTPSQSHVKGWALAFKAGELRRLGDTTEAAYLFSKVFANYPERRVQAYRNYHYIGAPFENVLKLANTPQEKANLYAIKAFADPEIGTADLEKVYDLAPGSPLVGVLLVREINKLEQYYLTPALSNNTDQFYSNRSFVTTKSPQPMSMTKRWLLWVAAVILFSGAIILITAFKKQEAGLGFKVIGGALLLFGAVGVSWFYVNKHKQTIEEIQQLPQGSFFVAMPDSVKSKYEAQIETLRNFCTKLTSDAKYPEPQVGTLVNAYLYFMQNKPDDGLSALGKMEGKPLSSKIADEKQILNLLLSAQRIKQIKEVDETALLPALKWLNNKVIAGGKPQTDVYPSRPESTNQFALTQRNFYSYVLAPAYLRQGDTTKAALALLKSDNSNGTAYRYNSSSQMPAFWYHYLHAAELKQIISWKVKRPNEPYMTFLSAGLAKIDDGNLYELLGTAQLREHHYQDALASFNNEKVKQNFAKLKETAVTSGNPFEVEINDYPQTATSGINKLEFAKKMAALEVKLKSDPKNADTYYQMATGIYNTSTYGNSWNMISYQWSSYDFGRTPLYYYDTDYIKTLLAKQYYLKARDLSTSREFKAKCTFMAAKCEQKQYEAPSFVESYDTFDKHEKAYLKQLTHNKYFIDLQQYKTTSFYKEAVDECSYLRDFIKSN